MQFIALLLVGASARSVTAAPAFDSVLTMLQNLVTQIETEEQSDQQDYSNYAAWFTQQSDATSASISMLESRLQELGAIIADLTSRQHRLSSEVNRLNTEIAQEQGQVDAARTKRTEEHDSFVKEQLDFDNSIKACEKAVELLQAHYGDGKPKESTRPAWMSLLNTLKTVQRVALAAKHPAAQHIAAFLQEPDFFNANGASLHNEHKDSTGEALSIVEQVQGLAATFAEDKQSSIDQEHELSAAFDKLMEQKIGIINELTTQRDQQQSVLNQVNQELGENQNAEATAKATHQDEQAYLSAITQQEKDTTALYEQRQQDRQAEKTAVSGAISVISSFAPKALLQVKRSAVVRKAKTGLKLRIDGCPQCHRVSQMLLAESKSLNSQLLATAAMTTGSGDALAPVVGQLTDLVQRLVEQQHAEEEHKAWCEKELSETAATKAHHEQLVAEFTAKIEETQAIIAEKQQAIADTAASIEEEDKGFAEITEVRKKAKEDFEVELQDYRDAITAINQAIDILGDFYRAELVQVDQVPVPGAADRNAAPGMASGGYEKKGGSRVVVTLKETRQDFEAGAKHLQEQEDQQLADYNAAKATYEKTRADLVDAGNRFSAELQGAQLALAQAQTDKAENEDKVQAATTYLAQVGGSCNVLIENFDMRTKLRADEKAAIEKAIGILQAAVF